MLKIMMCRHAIVEFLRQLMLSWNRREKLLQASDSVCRDSLHGLRMHLFLTRNLRARETKAYCNLLSPSKQRYRVHDHLCNVPTLYFAVLGYKTKSTVYWTIV